MFNLLHRLQKKLTKAVPALALSFAPLGKLQSSGVACGTSDIGTTYGTITDPVREVIRRIDF